MVVAGLDSSTRAAPRSSTRSRNSRTASPCARAWPSSSTSRRVNGRPIALIVGDPDRFKLVNDRRGHATGDAVLREIGARMRAMALGAGSSGYRLGGEEFVDPARATPTPAPARRSPSSCPRGDRRPRDRGSRRARCPSASPRATAGEPFDFSQLFGEADRALYEAKRAGGNRVRLWPLAGAPSPSHARRPQARRRRDAAGRPRAPRARIRRAAAWERRHERARSPARRPRRTEHVESRDRWARWNAQEHAATGNWLVRDDAPAAPAARAQPRAAREGEGGLRWSCFAVGGLSAIQYGWQILAAAGDHGHRLCPRRAPHRALPPSRIRARARLARLCRPRSSSPACSRTRRMVFAAPAALHARDRLLRRLPTARRRRRARVSRRSCSSAVASASTCQLLERVPGHPRLRPRLALLDRHARRRDRALHDRVPRPRDRRPADRPLQPRRAVSRVAELAHRARVPDAAASR